MTYDPLGRLDSIASGGVTTRFLHDGDAMTLEYNGAGTLLRRYVHGPGVDEPLIQYEGSGLTDRRHLHADHQGSVIAQSNATGTAIVTNRYDEYGVPASTNAGRFQYTGQIWLGELGLYHYKARVYDPREGRFLQTDPIGYDDQVNLYAYVGNDPVNKVDPTGMQKDLLERLEETAEKLRTSLSDTKDRVANTINDTIAPTVNAFEDMKNVTVDAFVVSIDEGAAMLPGSGVSDVDGSPGVTGPPNETLRGETSSKSYDANGNVTRETNRGHGSGAKPRVEQRTHGHDWRSPAPGQRPTHQDRGTGRRPQIGDPPNPRGPSFISMIRSWFK